MAKTRPTYDELFELYQMMQEYYPDRLREIVEIIWEEE